MRRNGRRTGGGWRLSPSGKVARLCRRGGRRRKGKTRKKRGEGKRGGGGFGGISRGGGKGRRGGAEMGGGGGGKGGGEHAGREPECERIRVVAGWEAHRVCSDAQSDAGVRRRRGYLSGGTDARQCGSQDRRIGRARSRPDVLARREANRVCDGAGAAVLLLRKHAHCRVGCGAGARATCG